MSDSILTLGYSPCPNDTFIFHGIADGRIGIGAGVERLEPFLADVEVLNQRARRAELDITKISFHALVHCLNDYWLLRAGGALGRGCGPIIVARSPVSIRQLENQSIAIPGKLTTAHMLLQLLGMHRGERPELPFDRIMPAVQAGEVDAGLVIHEGRFTYADHGLHLVLDLGAWWERRSGLPLPLGCIVIRRSLGEKVARRVDAAIHDSLRAARAAPEDTWSYVRGHAQEMEDRVIRQHIDTFVNDYSLDIGEDGKKAVRIFLATAAEMEQVHLPDRPLYWDEAGIGAGKKSLQRGGYLP